MMSYTVRGGRPLEGRVRVHGAKNAALPILAASLLCGDGCRIENCPDIADVGVTLAILRHLGTQTVRGEDGSLTLTARPNGATDIPDALMKRMRSSVIFLGAMLSTRGSAQMVLPGGCALGARPIDLHLSAMEQMGATVEQREDSILCRAPDGLHGAQITLPLPSVGATENILIAASAARGETVLRGGAREPEIGDLIEFLRGCGVSILADTDGALHVAGMPERRGCTHAVLPDRIEACTYLAAAAATGGRVELDGCLPQDMMLPLAYLSLAGCVVRLRPDGVGLIAPRRLAPFGSISTGPYPGFPTDLQAIFMAAAATAEGTTEFRETVFENRYRHVAELQKLGAQITLAGRRAVVVGSAALHGASLRCTDLRGGAAAVAAALAARGESAIADTRPIARGYQDFAAGLRALGAQIEGRP